MSLRDLSVPLFFPPMHEIVPQGKSGNVAVVHIDVDRRDSLEALVGSHQCIPPGKYVSLNIDDVSVMSDIPYEHYTNIEVVERATGNILIAGLGIGMILTKILPKRSVTSAVVVERNPHVISLVSCHLEQHFRTLWRKVQIINSDAFDYEPTKGHHRFDCIYTDVPHMRTVTKSRNQLNRRWRRALTPNGWIGHWEGTEARTMRRLGLDLSL